MADQRISSLTVGEFRRGILEKPVGKKRRELERWFSGPDGPPALFAGGVLPFDEKAGLVWAGLMAEGTAGGRPRSPLDMIVAAVADANDCVVVTEKERDFARAEGHQPLALRPMKVPFGGARARDSYSFVCDHAHANGAWDAVPRTGRKRTDQAIRPWPRLAAGVLLAIRQLLTQ